MIKSRSRFRTWAPRLAVGCLAALSLTGVYAFRLVFARPGEAALQLVPADALAVASIDLGPSPEQALTFKHIDDALARNGVKEPFQRSLLDLVIQSPAAEPLRELTTRSAAVCLMKGEGKEDDLEPVLLMPITDGAAAQAVLTQKGRPEFWKGTQSYRLPQAKADMMVIGNTLLISPAPWAMHEVAQVAAGERPAITGSADYVKARELEPGNANLMVFVSPKMMTELEKHTATKSGGWLTAGMTIEDGGLALSCHGYDNSSDNEIMKRIASTAPLRADLSKVLPEGAYGVMAFSQPSKIFDAVRGGVKEADFQKGLTKVQKQVADETGIDIDSDVIPGFSGDAVLAAYPTVSPNEGIDLIAVFDNQNGANPVALAEKFQAYVNRQASKDKEVGANWLTKLDRTDIQGYRLSDKVENDIKKDIHLDGLHTDVLVDKKTVAWATVNGAVIIATSQDLLNRAVDAYQGKTASMATDTVMKPAADSTDGSQMLAAFSLSRIAEGVKNTVIESKMGADAQKTFDQVITTFGGLTQPFAIRSHVSPDGSTSGSLFIPIDYEKVIDLIGSSTNKK